MSWPAVLLWLVILSSFASRGPALLYVFQISTVFGMLQMLPAGSLNFLPGTICAGFLILKIFTRPGNVSRAADLAFDPRCAGLFLAFLLYAIVTSFALPRLFEGQVAVVPISGLGSDLLAPSAGNTSQTLYIILSFSLAIAFAVGISNEAFARHYLRAVLAGGVFIVASGLIDLMLWKIGHTNWLDAFRTASYRDLSESEVAGSKRIVGLTPEASAYAALCIGALTTLVFLRPFYEARLRRTYVPLAIAALVAMTLLSTSSSAYAGFCVFSVLYGIDLILRSYSTDLVVREGLAVEITLLATVAVAALAVVVFSPGALRQAERVIDVMVLNKTASSSYVERSMWTRLGVQAFFDTGALGAGLGSIRTSNWFVSILASAGLFGASMLFSFIIRVILWPQPGLPRRARQLRRGLSFALIPTLAMSALGGTIPDIGVHTASLYGLLAGVLAAARATTPESLRAAQPRPRIDASIASDASRDGTALKQGTGEP